MTTNHTPTPWHVEQAADGMNLWVACPRYTVATVSCIANHVNVGETDANAARIVACVNACDGIATEKLEKVAGDPAPVFALLMETATERDALLAALNRLTNAAFARDTTMGDQCALFAAQAELRDATKIAREAIAKATGATA